MGKKKIGEFDFANIVNTTIGAVNEALIDGKNNKNNNNKSNSGKGTVKVDLVKGKTSDVEAAIAKVTKPQKTPVDFIPDTSKVDKARKEAEKPIKTEAEIKYKETKIPLMGEVKLPSNLDKKTLNDAKAYAKALETAISSATTKVTNKTLAQLNKNANVKDFMSQYPELASTSDLDSKVRGGVTSFINKNNISSDYQEQVAELFRIGNIIKKINESYSSKLGLFETKEYETLDEMLAARQRQADVLAYHDRLVEQFNKNNTPDNLGGHQVATRNYFTKKNSELIPGFNTSVTEEVSQKALIGDIKTSLEAGGEGIATVFITAAKSIGAGSKEVIDALKSVQTELTTQAKDAGKRDILDTKNRELSNAKDKILETIEKNDAKTSRATLNRYRREHDFQNEDLSPTVQAGILGNLLVYKYKGGTGLKDLQDFDDVKNLIFEQDTTGFFKKIYEEQSAKLFLEQQDAEKKAVSSSAPKTTTPKKKSTSKSTSSKSPTIQAKKTEKTADAVDTAVDHINDAVASAAGNTTENIDQMANSTERLDVATEETAKKQEESVKQEERKYKVTSAPKLKVSTDTAQSKSDREEQRVRIIQAKKNAQAAENEQSFIAHKENFLTGYKSGNLLGSTYNGFKLSPEKLLGFLEQDNPYKNYRLVSNKEDINGRKKTTVYKDDQTGRSYTRTLTKDSDGLWRQSGGDIKSGYAALETEAINIEKRLMTEREDLADMEAGIAKNNSQSNIKASKKRIRYLKGRMKSLRADAETYAQEHPEYTTEQFDEAIQKGIEQHRIDMNERAGNRISDQIISEYTDLMNGLSELEKKNKELSSAKSKGASNELINNLRKEIDNKQKNIEDTDKFIEQHSDVLGKDRVNAYNTQKSKLGEAEQGAYSAFQKENTQKNIDDYNQTYDSAIAKVKELKQAYVDLYNIQANGASGKYGKDEYIEKVNAQVDKIKSLRKEVGDFYNTVYDNNKSNPDRILDQKKFDSYQKAFDDMSDYSNFDGKNNNIIELMKKAYSNKRNNENKLLGLATKDGADITAGKILGENYTNAYQSLRAQVNSIFGKEVAENAISDIRNRANATQDQLISNNSNSFLNQVDSYLTKLESAGRITDRLKADLESIKTSTKDAESAFNQNKNANGILDYVDKMQEQTEKFTDLKNHYENTVTGNDELNFAEQINKLNKFANSGNKIDAYKDKITEFRTRYNQLVDSFNNKEINENGFHDSVNEIISDIEKFQKTASGYEKENGKGILQEGTLGTIKDIDDATSALRNYASQLGLTNEVSTSINKSTGSISLVFKDVSGNLVTLTGNIEKANDSLRTMEKYTNKSGTSGFTSLSDSLKGLVKGNFTSALGDVANAVGSIQIMQQAWQQMREGFNTFMDYDKALTTISYTMDMNKQQLSDLGTSAVDMAKDLSMSLDNTMDIYQIYANMNTTSKEIQETAKPTAILSNLSGVDASTAADQVQGILQQFHMLEDGSTSAADASMHVVDVMDKISSNVGMDYAKGIKVMSDAVQASGQVAYDAGMSYEQLAAISAKVAERTREDGSSIGNALKTIITRTTKVGKMPQYADEVDNATLSNASASLHSVGVDVYNPDGSDRGIVTVLSELKSKWNDLTDAQQAKIAFDVAATRQTSKFKNILDAFTDSMSLAEEATNAQGNAEANQEKYMESFNGKVQAIKTQMDEFWLNFYNSDQVGGALDFVHGLTEGFTGLEKTLGPIPALITAIFSAMTVKNAGKKGLDFLIGGGLKTAVG